MKLFIHEDCKIDGKCFSTFPGKHLYQSNVYSYRRQFKANIFIQKEVPALFSSWQLSEVFNSNFFNGHCYKKRHCYKKTWIYSRLQHECQTQVTRVRHERHKCNTSATLATRVRHKCGMSATLTTQVRDECYTNDTSETHVKNFDFNNDKSKNIFSHPYIYYMATERL